MSAGLELLRAAQEGDRDACEQAVIESARENASKRHHIFFIKHLLILG